MVQIRASQVFTHSIDDAVAAKKALDADELFKDVVEKYSCLLYTSDAADE